MKKLIMTLFLFTLVNLCFSQKIAVKFDIKKKCKIRFINQLSSPMIKSTKDGFMFLVDSCHGLVFKTFHPKRIQNFVVGDFLKKHKDKKIYKVTFYYDKKNLLHYKLN